VCIQVIEEGSDGAIKKGDPVAVIYKGMLIDGTVFETTDKKSPFLLKAGEGESVDGLDSAISSLIAGSKARVFIPAKMAYGPNKVRDKIPAFSNLIFELEVIRQQKK
jgi:FKBP-type peptidyl-prolyl cis-trans isomerase